MTTLRTTSVWSRLEERWNQIQLGRQGSYSIERVESLDQYCKTASKTRVLLVCVLSPLPALSIAVFLEFLPLCPPSEGWQANWVFWIRLSLLVFTINYAEMAQLTMLIPGLNATFIKRFMASAGASAAFMGICILTASTVGFPVPFVIQLGGTSMSIFIPLAIRLVLGREPFSSTSPCRPHLQQFYRFTAAYIMLVAGFPIYKVFYDFVPVTYQGSAVIILTVWKFGAKHFIMRASREWGDLIPENVAFSADFVSSLFVSVCISTSGSRYLTAAFIIVDLGQSLLEFREVRANASVVVNLLRERGRSLNFKNENSADTSNGSLLAMILAVTRNPSAFSIRSIASARLRACLPYPITPD